MSDNEKELVGKIIIDSDEATKGAAQSVRAIGSVVEAFDKAVDASGRYVDAQGRMREANGRFVAGAQQVNPLLANQTGLMGQLNRAAAGALRGVTALSAAQAALGLATDAVSVALGVVTTALQATAVAIGVTAAAAGFAVQQFAAYESAFARVTTIVDTNTVNTQKLSDQVRDLAVAYGIDAVDAARALADVIGSGISEENSVAFLAESMKAAKAGFTDVGPVVKTFAGIVASYGLDAAEAGRVSDVLFQTVKSGVTTIGELSATFSRVGPIAAAAGVSLEETAAAVATLTVRGFTTEQAITGVRAALGAVLKPAEGAREALQGIGVTAEALRSVGLTEVMNRLGTATGGTADQMFDLLGDLKAVNAAAVLSTDTGLADLTRILGEMEGAAGSTDEALAKVAATITDKLARAAETVQDTIRVIGEMLTPLAGALLEPFAEFATETRAEFFQLRDDLMPIIEGWAAAFSSFAGGVSTDGGLITTTLNAVAAGLDYVNGFVVTYQVEIAKALGAVETFFDFLMMVGESIWDSSFIKPIRSVINGLISLIELVWEVAEAIGLVTDKTEKWRDRLGAVSVETKNAAGAIRDYSNGLRENVEHQREVDLVTESRRKHAADMHAEDMRRAREREEVQAAEKARAAEWDAQFVKAKEEEAKARDKAVEAMEKEIESGQKWAEQQIKQHEDRLRREEAAAEAAEARATRAAAANAREAKSVTDVWKEYTRAIAVRQAATSPALEAALAGLQGNGSRRSARSSNDAGASLFGLNGPSFGFSSSPSGGSSIFGLGSFERGGRIPETGPINAHRAEFMVPAPAAAAVGPHFLETLRGMRPGGAVTIGGPTVNIHVASSVPNATELAKSVAPELDRVYRLGLRNAGVKF